MAVILNNILKYRETENAEWQEATLAISPLVNIPAGGKTNQLLAKNTNDNFDVKWLIDTVGSATVPIYFHNGVPTTTGISLDILPKLGLYKADILSNNWTYYADNTVVDNTSNANKWRFQKYTSITMNQAGLETLNGMTPNLTNYYLDSATSAAMNIADSYSAKCTTYLYCEQDCIVPMKFETDDAGSVYLNGNFICSITSTKWTDIQELQFQAGENELIICYTEGSGGDGWVCDPKPSTLVGTTFLAMSAVQLGGYEQTVTPTKIAGNGSITANTILFNLSTAASTTAAIKESSVLQAHANSIANSDGTITLKTTENLKTDMDLTAYWIACDVT